VSVRAVQEKCDEKGGAWGLEDLMRERRRWDGFIFPTMSGRCTLKTIRKAIDDSV
jgi:hypothetical protein